MVSINSVYCLLFLYNFFLDDELYFWLIICPKYGNLRHFTVARTFFSFLCRVTQYHSKCCQPTIYKAQANTHFKNLNVLKSVTTKYSYPYLKISAFVTKTCLIWLLCAYSSFSKMIPLLVQETTKVWERCYLLEDTAHMLSHFETFRTHWIIVWKLRGPPARWRNDVMGVAGVHKMLAQDRFKWKTLGETYIIRYLNYISNYCYLFIFLKHLYCHSVVKYV